ncbi:hypothetical protein FKW77_007405 [Venturia effusa]|uniref:Uncharacterized protein n=1 Tax=Venturia effusa TaxID=50376 RepID=A0A517L5Q0_9PEZI|nr:hypothetical protein FKW77_007405 [Venturia effusa]
MDAWVWIGQRRDVQKKARTLSIFGGKYKTGDSYNAISPGGTPSGIQTINSDLLFFGEEYH